MRIIPINYADTADLSSNLLAIPTINNLKKTTRSRVMTTTAGAAGTEEITGTWDSVQNISAIVLGRHSLEVGSTLKFELFSDDAWITPVYTSSVISINTEDVSYSPEVWGAFTYGGIPWGYGTYLEGFELAPNFVHWIDAEYSVQSFKITIVLTTGDINISRLILGTTLEPSYNISYKHTLTLKEDTKQYRINGGTLRSSSLAPRRSLTFSLNTIEESERAVFQSNLEYIGRRKDFFISLFPLDSSAKKIRDYSGIMKFTKTPQFTGLNIYNNYYKANYEVEEV